MGTATVIVPAVAPAQVAAAREPFFAYQADIVVDLAHQGFELEFAELPGAYAPPGGRLLLAMMGDPMPPRS